MAKRKSRATWGRRSGLFLDFSGVENIIKALDELGADSKPAARKAVKRCAELATNELNAFMTQHVETGATLAALIEPTAGQTKNLVRASAGFEREGKPITLKDGKTGVSTGYVAVLFDVGAPNIKPTSFIYNTFRGTENAKKYTAIMDEEYIKLLQKAQKKMTGGGNGN